jgi:hypothetical protein
MKDEAIGAWEAAAIMGVHWSRVRRMADAGAISVRVVCGQEGREFAVYSRDECEQNYRDYVANRQGGRRPRTAVHERPAAIKLLAAKGRPKIKFGDAIGAYEAAKILGVFWTLVPRLAKEGKIVGRILHSGRASQSRLWVLSRQSCEARAAESSRLEQSGQKMGRPRKSFVDR